MIKIIDPHLHLFDLKQGEYHWLKADTPPLWPDKPLINKSFNEKDLALKAPLSLTGFVHIEAGFDNAQAWRELSYLQESCQLPFTAIASIDLTLETTNFTNQLNQLLDYTSFCGVRHILDDQALSLLNCKQVQENIHTLNNLANKCHTKRHFIFEVQLPLDDNPSVNSLCDVISHNKNLTFMINHAGFPSQNLESNSWDNWRVNLTQLSLFDNTAIKCSGWEMIDRQYTHQRDWLNMNLESCFNAFGTHRMMLASNFPLCLFTHSNYDAYWQSLLNTPFMQAKNEQEKSALCYHNALKYYGLPC